jgi:hypothetical protein
MNTNCPQCQSSRTVAKVSDVYYDCIATPGKYPRLVWEEQRERFPLQLDAARRDELADRLAPPPMPRRADSDDAGEVGFAAAGGVADAGFDGGFIGMLIILTLFAAWGLLVLMLKLIFKRVRRLTGKPAGADWQLAIAHWNSLYYCAQCDAVFVPGQDKAIPSKRMSSLLNALMLDSL